MLPKIDWMTQIAYRYTGKLHKNSEVRSGQLEWMSWRVKWIKIKKIFSHHQFGFGYFVAIMTHSAGGTSLHMHHDHENGIDCGECDNNEQIVISMHWHNILKISGIFLITNNLSIRYGLDRI